MSDHTSPAIFITGASGLVGSHLVRLLQLNGYDRITALRRSDSDLSLLSTAAESVRWIEGDLFDLDILDEGMSDADWVIHCAGCISYHPGDREKLYQINAEGTAHVVNAALGARVKRFLHVSSVSVLSRTGRQQTISEDTPWAHTPYTSQYGLSKHLAEQEVQRGIAEGLHASIIIPSIILGAGNWHDGSATIFHQIGKGMPMYPLGQNGFVDVRDVALLCLCLLREEKMHRVIASGHTVTYKDLFTEIARRIGKKPPGIAVGPGISEIVWRLLVPVRWITGKVPVINKETTRAAQSFPVYDNSASLRIPGFQYTPMPDTLDAIAACYLDAAEKNFQSAYLPFPARFRV